MESRPHTLEVDIVAVTNMPEAGKGKRGKSSQAQKNLNDKRSKRRFVQIANTNFGTNDFHISATYNNEHLPMSLEEAEKNVHNYLDRIKRKMKRETGEDLKYMLVTEYTPEEEEGQLTLQGIDTDDKTTKAVKQLGRYTEAEVLAAVINGLFTVFIEKESASDDVPFGESIPEEMQVDQEDENSIELAPGAVIDLGEGEKANMVNPGRPNPNFDPFVIAVLKQIGAALEIPYEILIMAFSSNYSASRAAILEFFKVVKMYRAWFVADFCQPIYEEWLSEAVAKGRIKAPGFFTDPIIKDAYCSAEWTGPSAGQLDPTKEVEAAEKRVQGGYSTREREARELTGTDFYKNIKQRKREEELLKEVTGGAKTDAQTVENINGREESDTENNPDNDGGQTEEETEE